MKPIKNNKSGTAGQNWFPLVATTLDGLEETLAAELRQIGGNDIMAGKRAVNFTGDLDLIYKANLRLRTALRILKPLFQFEAATPEALYQEVKSINWPGLFDAEKTFSIKAAVFSENFTHSQYVALKTKDAIADCFREKVGQRPNVDAQNAQIGIHIRVSGTSVIISLDASGQSLHKRGYRDPASAAPLNEALAAGIILNTNFDSHRPLIDPMCGSGTLPIEAALIANNIAPGLLRNDFAFMHWRDFDAELFKIIHEATVNRITDKQPKIYGFDRNFRDIDIAKASAKRAGVEDMIQFERREFFASKPPEKFGTVVMNPPYDLRLKVDDIHQFYRKIGDKLKTDYTGYTAYVFTGNQDAMKSFGLRSSKKLALKNGQIESKLFGFELYSGSKKDKSDKPENNVAVRKTGTRPRIKESDKGPQKLRLNTDKHDKHDPG